MSSAWVELLQKTKAKDLLKDQKLIDVQSVQLLKDVLPIMKVNNLLAVPVKDNEKTLGFVDVLDITAFAVHVWESHSRLYTYWKSAKFSECSANKKFFDTPVKDIINFSKMDRYVMLPENSSLADVLKALRRNRNSYHRIALVNDKHQCVKVVSQSDINNFASHHSSAIALGTKTIQDLNLMRCCVMVPFDTPVGETLRVLTEHKISGLSLVDWENKLMANFSASDLKGMMPRAFVLFNSSTLDFLRQGTEVKSLTPPITCSANARLDGVMDTLAKKHAHRIFVTDTNNHPIGIVSLTDIMSVLQEGLDYSESAY